MGGALVDVSLDKKLSLYLCEKGEGYKQDAQGIETVIVQTIFREKVPKLEMASLAIWLSLVGVDEPFEMFYPHHKILDNRICMVDYHPTVIKFLSS